MSVSDFPCRHCGKTWPHAEKYWHCSVCHETYTGEQAWEAHRDWGLCHALEPYWDGGWTGKDEKFPVVWTHHAKTKYCLRRVDDERGFTHWQRVGTAVQEVSLR